jgi:hypothetical protein
LCRLVVADLRLAISRAGCAPALRRITSNAAHGSAHRVAEILGHDRLLGSSSFAGSVPVSVV